MKNIVGEVIEQANKNIKIEKCDYFKDGMLYCGKCNTPKQCIVKSKTVNCLCGCETEKREAEKEQFIKEQKMIKIAEMRKMGFDNNKLSKYTFDKCDNPKSEHFIIAKKYAENFKEMKRINQGLIFYGDVGVGKTFASACIVNYLLDRLVPCMMTNFPRLINVLSGMFANRQEYIDKLNDFDLLIIDDFAVERDTEYVNETVQNIIDARYRANKPLIITTNLTENELLNPTNLQKKRTYSRLLEMCRPVKVVSKERRIKVDNYEEMKKILGV